MQKFGLLAQRLFNTPVAIKPEKAEVIMAALADRLGVGNAAYLNGDNIKITAGNISESDAYDYDRAGYDVVDGVAVIPVHGTLVNKLGTLRPYSGMTGYDGIRANIVLALSDHEVKAIMLDIDSPGGEVAGCFDLVDDIYKARGQKPIHAILNECAYSAAYAIASAADKITVPRTGGVGSVGVICMHVDWSKAITNAGIKVTFITYGDCKADGHPEIPLSDDAFKRIQDDITAMGELFVKTVARNRGLSVAAVRETQAATYMGQSGVKIGLADVVAAPDAAFHNLLDSLA